MAIEPCLVMRLPYAVSLPLVRLVEVLAHFLLPTSSTSPWRMGIKGLNIALLSSELERQCLTESPSKFTASKEASIWMSGSTSL